MDKLHFFKLNLEIKDKIKENYGAVFTSAEEKKRKFPDHKNVLCYVGSINQLNKYFKTLTKGLKDPEKLSIDNKLSAGMFNTVANNLHAKQIEFKTNLTQLSDRDAENYVFFNPDNIYNDGQGYQVAVDRFVVKGRGKHNVPINLYECTPFNVSSNNPDQHNCVLFGNIRFSNATKVELVNGSGNKIYTKPDIKTMEQIIPKEYHKQIIRY